MLLRLIRDSLIILLTIGAVWFISDRAQGVYYYYALSPNEILLRQLHGDGCGYKTLCEYDINGFSGWNIRNPEYHCRMIAADCLVKFRVPYPVAQPAIEQALQILPDNFDTGDGIIRYGNCLRGALAQIQSNSFSWPVLDC